MVKEKCFYCKEKLGFIFCVTMLQLVLTSTYFFVFNLHFSNFVYRNSISIQNEQVPFFQALKDHVSVSP